MERGVRGVCMLAVGALDVGVGGVCARALAGAPVWDGWACSACALGTKIGGGLVMAVRLLREIGERKGTWKPWIPPLPPKS